LRDKGRKPGRGKDDRKEKEEEKEEKKPVQEYDEVYVFLPFPLMMVIGCANVCVVASPSS
jgi:hypothetical protein